VPGTFSVKRKLTRREEEEELSRSSPRARRNTEGGRECGMGNRNRKRVLTELTKGTEGHGGGKRMRNRKKMAPGTFWGGGNAEWGIRNAE